MYLNLHEYLFDMYLIKYSKRKVFLDYKLMKFYVSIIDSKEKISIDHLSMTVKERWNATYWEIWFLIRYYRVFSFCTFRTLKYSIDVNSNQIIIKLWISKIIKIESNLHNQINNCSYISIYLFIYLLKIFSIINLKS